MGNLAPLADTERVIGWDELPASVKEIPANFNPTQRGVLMKHQQQWIKIQAPIKACPKGRRTGMTFAEALDDTITAASRRDAGGDNVYYIPDAKEKGLEFIGYCAKFSRVIAAAQGQGVSDIEQFLFVDQDKEGNTKHITAWRIRYASGFQIVALSSRPASIRGLQGIVVIDEAAFHTDVQAVLDAATALLIWGGKIRIISSHNGKKNPFNQLILDIQAGKLGKEAVTFKATFDDAVANGLYERVCFKIGETPTPEGKKKWYERIRKGYGTRVSAMREELDAIPRDGGGSGIPGVLIERAMQRDRPVLRLEIDENFLKWDEGTRASWGEEWIERNLQPLVRQLDAGARYALGMDYARHRHFSIIAPAEIRRNMSRSVPFVIEMMKVPTRLQEQVLWYLMRDMPNHPVLAIDATGPGLVLAEYTGDKFGGDRVHQVTLSRSWYSSWMPHFMRAFEEESIIIPADDGLDSDLRQIQSIDGVPMVPAIEKKDLKDPDQVRHGDFAIAGALMWFASLQNTYQPYAYESVGGSSDERDGQSFMRPRGDDDNDAGDRARWRSQNGVF